MPEEEREFTEKEKRKLRIVEEQRVLRIHKEEFKPFWESMTELHRSEIDLMRGIVYGLLLGLFGNFVVQYSFPLFEGMLLRQYNSMFFASIGIIVISTLVISITLLRFSKQRKEEERQLKVALDGIIQEQHEIDAREVRLDAMKQGLIQEDVIEAKDTPEDKT